jgi:hypothetical protein
MVFGRFLEQKLKNGKNDRLKPEKTDIRIKNHLLIAMEQ